LGPYLAKVIIDVQSICTSYAAGKVTHFVYAFEQVMRRCTLNTYTN